MATASLKGELQDVIRNGMDGWSNGELQEVIRNGMDAWSNKTKDLKTKLIQNHRKAPGYISLRCGFSFIYYM